MFLALLMTMVVNVENHKHRVAVIDTGLDLSDSRFKDVLCENGHYDFTSQGKMKDVHGHGSHIAGLIKQYAKDSDYCLMIYKYYDENADGHTNTVNTVRALILAIKNGADIVNYSGGGPEFSEREFLLIKENPKVTFVVAAGNDNENYNNKFYPAAYNLPNMIVVGCKDIHNVKCKSSNYGNKVVGCKDIHGIKCKSSNHDHRVIWENGELIKSTLPEGKEGYLTGTSQSTAIRTGKLIYERWHR